MLTRRKTLFRFCCCSCDEFHRKLNAQMPHQQWLLLFPIFILRLLLFHLPPVSLARPRSDSSLSLWWWYWYFSSIIIPHLVTHCVQWNDSLAFSLLLFYYIIIFCASFSLIFSHSLSLRAGFCWSSACPSNLLSHSALCIVCFSFILTLLSPNEWARALRAH